MSDYGRSKDLHEKQYYMADENVRPIRWLAPEALTEGKYSVKSDIVSKSLQKAQTGFNGNLPACCNKST